MEQNISFSKKLKTEIADMPYTCKECVFAQVYGMLLFGKCLTSDLIMFSTEHKAIVDRFVGDIVETTSSIVTIKYVGSRYRKDGKLYIASVDNPEDCAIVRRYFPPVSEIPEFSKSCCKTAFLRGAFLACGSVIDPNKEYHLEFVVQDQALADAFREFLLGLGVQIKTTYRKGSQVLYLKESEHIEDMITMMGAYQSSLEIMNIKIVKDVRNKVNRVTNCETANLTKTVTAAAAQIEAIKKIKANGGIESLPEDLQEIARLRFDNPDMSLRELCEQLSTPISRSGVNHRLQRITAIAGDLK